MIDDFNYDVSRPSQRLDPINQNQRKILEKTSPICRGIGNSISEKANLTRRQVKYA